MKKLLLLSLALLGVVVSFTSCESQDPGNKLSGKTYECHMDSEILIFDSFPYYDYTSTFKFKYNGHVYYKCDGKQYNKYTNRYDYDCWLDLEVESDFLKYKVEGDKVTIYWDNEEQKLMMSGYIEGNTIRMTEGVTQEETYTQK